MTFISLTSFAQSNVKYYSEAEVRQIESNLHKKVEKNLSSFLGKIKFSTFVKVITNQRPINDRSGLSSALFLIGPTLEEENLSKRFSIVGVESKTVVYEGLNDTFNKEISSISRDSLYPYEVLKIETSYIESTRFVAEQLEKGNEDALGMFEKFLKENSSEVIRLLGVLFLAAVVCFGIVMLSKLVKGPLHLIAESFNRMAQEAMNRRKMEEEAARAANEDITLSEGEAAQLSNQFRANLEIFKEVIMTHPEDVKSIVVDSDEGASGIKKVLPYVYEKKYIDNLKKVMTPKELEKMNDSEFNFERSYDFFKWFNKTVEKISVKQIGETWTVVEKLPADILKPLLKIKNSVLKEYAESNRSIIAYQITLDILKGKERKSFIKSLSVDEWKQIIGANDLDVNEIQSVAEEMVEFSKNHRKGEGVVSADRIKDTVVLPSLLNILPFKDLKVQDDFISSLSTVSKEIINDLKEFYWTPRNLLQVPSSHMNEVLRDYDVEQKANILVSLPGDVAEYLKSVIPEGKVKTIIEERVQDFDESKDKEKATKITRDFIDRLFGDYKSNKLQLEAEILQMSSMSVEDDLDEGDFGDMDDDFEDDFDDVA